MRDMRDVDVTLGEGLVVLKRYGQSQPILARILGVDRDDEGNEKTIYLDRIVHRLGEAQFNGWHVSGALTTIMERMHSPKAS